MTFAHGFGFAIKENFYIKYSELENVLTKCMNLY